MSTTQPDDRNDIVVIDLVSDDEVIVISDSDESMDEGGLSAETGDGGTGFGQGEKMVEDRDGGNGGVRTGMGVGDVMDDSEEDESEEEELEDWGLNVVPDDVGRWLSGVDGVVMTEIKFVESLSDRGLQVYEDWKDQEIDVKVKSSKISNFGLFVDEDVQAGEVILEYDGIRYPKRMKEMVSEKYSEAGIKEVYMLECGDTIVDATVRGGPLRFANHSCSPNVELVEVML